MNAERETTVTIDGGICGHLWMPDVMGGKAASMNLSRVVGRFSTAPDSMREILLHVLMEHGGDFQNARFTDDTLIIVRRRWKTGATQQSNTRYVRVADWKGCKDLTHADSFACDFLGEE